jgi:hypothetical protein
MTAPWVIDQRSREAVRWALDFLERHHPAPEASDQLGYLRELENELGASLNEAPAYATALTVAALVDIVEELMFRVEQLEDRMGAFTDS